MAGASCGVDVFGPDVSGGGSSLSADFFAGQFGDGSDGDLTIIGTYTAGREMHFNNLTLANVGDTFKPNGFRIYVRGTLTIGTGASVNDDGNSSTNQAGGLILNTRNYLGGAGTQGGNGWAITAVNWANGNAGTANSNTSLNNLGQAPTGGKGGDISLRGNVGGAGGASAQPTPNQKWNGRWFDGRWSGGTFNGSSSGGGGAINVTSYTSGTFISGGGGGGAGIVWLAARYINNNGRISSNGGNGGPGSLGVGTGECAGGGGGGGGKVTVITQTPLGNLGSIQVLGGTGGTGAYNVGTGVNINGTNGNQGSLCIIVMS